MASLLQLPLHSESFLVTAYAACITFLLAIAVKPMVPALFSPLSQVPGPFLARFTRLWEMYAFHRHEYALYSIELHKKYGPIVRLAPNRYSVNDPEAVKILLGHKDSLDKAPFYSGFGTPGRPSVFTALTKSLHAELRKPISHLYSPAHLLGYEPAVDDCNHLLIERLRECASSEKIVDVRELVQFYSFDVIGEITLGSRFGFLEENCDKNGIIASIRTAITFGASLGLIPRLSWWFYNSSVIFGVDNGLKALDSFLKKHLEDRVQGRTSSPPDRMDFLDKLLPLVKEGKAKMSDVFTVLEQNVGAGTDTSAISISSVIAYLAMNPATLAALRKEIDQATLDGTLSTPAKFQEARKLPYLEAVVKETMRIHPAVGVILARTVGKNGVYVAGQYFPPGTDIGINPWVLHRNESIFGPDANQFRPERWLTQDQNALNVLDKNLLSFGSGPRTCIGKNVSLLEMYKIIPEIVRRFDWEIIPDKETGKPFSQKTAWIVFPTVKCIFHEKLS